MINETLPMQTGHRNRQIFELARTLKAVREFADAAADDLRPIVRQWHVKGVADGVIGTVDFEESWCDFVECWPKVKYPRGGEPVVAIHERSQSRAAPRAAERYESEHVRDLVGLCRELQEEAGSEPFYLDCRTAGRLLGVDHIRAWRYLRLLQHDGLIELVEKGIRGRASTFHWKGDDE